MEPAIITRIASSADIPLIRELAELTWWPAYRTILSAEQIRYMLDNLYSPRALEEQMQEGHNFLLIYENETPLGFASWSATPEPGTCKLQKIYVLPATQGKGTGRLLVETVEKKAREAGASVLELNVNRLNSALNFYRKLGFTVQGTADIPIGPYFMNDYIMRKKL